MNLRMTTAIAVLCTCLLPAAADAAGFYLQEQSVSQQGAAFAGAAANPLDASTIFYNPAGITELGRRQVTGGVSVIMPRLEFSNTGSTGGPTGGPFAAYPGNNGGNPFDPTPIPAMYGAAPVSDDGKFWVGLGISSPFGLANEYKDGWFGRYDSTSSELTTINFAPVLAYKFNDRVSIAGGPNIQYARAKLENALPCPTVICGGGALTPATDGFSQLKGSSWGYGLNLGTLITVTDRTKLGVHYRSEINQTIDNGVVTVAGLLGPLAAGNGVRTAEAELKQPDVLSVGVSHEANDRLTLLGSYNWYGWSNFDEIRVKFDTGGPDSVTPQNYDNSYSVALGAQWKQNKNWTFRGGVQYDQTPTTLPDRSTRTPDSDRYWASFGATFGINDNFLLDFAASHIFMEDGKVGLTKNFYTGTGADTTVNISGTTNTSIDIFSLQATWEILMAFGIPIKYVNAWRNVKGRYDLMMFLCKWDTDYRKDLIITVLAYILFFYSLCTWNTIYDVIAMAVEASIIMVQVGGEMSILPSDYRPSHGGVKYTVQSSTHIAYDELSFLMSGVYPAEKEEALGFANPIAALGVCKESPLVSNDVDDTLMLREKLVHRLDESETNYIRSRHQLRYIAIRVANKLQHTTNGTKLALYDMADALVKDAPICVRKSYYFDALLTAEAFRSRIFRNNIQGEKEVYTDLTTYFPVKEEMIHGQDGVRFLPDFYKDVSGHIGITTLLVTENRRVVLLHQGSTKAVGSHTVTFGGSGSMNFSDMELAKSPDDLRNAIAYGMAREMCEETGMEKYFEEVRRNTMVTGFFRWIDRCGKPEFVGLTRAGDIPFSKMQAIDGDEVVKFEEVPVTLNTLKDFYKVLAWVKDSKANVALSSLMALHRLTVIAGYGEAGATPEQRRVHQRVSEFLFGSLAYLDKAVAKPYSIEDATRQRS